MDLFSYQAFRRNDRSDPVAMITGDHPLIDPERPMFANPIATAASLFRSLERRLTKQEPMLNPSYQLLAQEARSIVAQQTQTTSRNDIAGLADLEIPGDAMDANVQMTANQIALENAVRATFDGPAVTRVTRELMTAVDREALGSGDPEFSSPAVRAVFEGPAGRNMRASALVVAGLAASHAAAENRQIAEDNLPLNEDERADLVNTADVYRGWRRSFTVEVTRAPQKWTTNYNVVMATNEESIVMKKFIDLALRYAENRETPSRAQLTTDIAAIRRDLAVPKTVSERITVDEPESREQLDRRQRERDALIASEGRARTAADTLTPRALQKNAVRVRVIEPAIDMRPHAWKKVAVVRDQNGVRGADAVAMPYRRVVGIEGQQYYSNVDVIAATLRTINARHQKFVDRQVMLAEQRARAELARDNPGLTAERRASMSAEEITAFEQRREQTIAREAANRGAQVKRDAVLNIISHASADSDFGKALMAAAEKVGMDTLTGSIAIEKHRQTVVSNATGSSVDGEFDLNGFKRVDVTSEFQVNRVQAKYERSMPNLSDIGKAVKTDLDRLTADERKAMRAAHPTIAKLADGKADVKANTFAYKRPMEEFIGALPFKDSASYGLLTEKSIEPVPFLSGVGANAASNKLVMVAAQVKGKGADSLSFRAEMSTISNAALTPDRLVVFGQGRGSEGRFFDPNVAKIVHRRALSGMAAPIVVDKEGQLIRRDRALKMAAERGPTMKERAEVQIKQRLRDSVESVIPQRTILEAIGVEKAKLVLTHFKTPADAVAMAEAASAKPKEAKAMADKAGIPLDALKAAGSLRRAMSDEAAYAGIQRMAEASEKTAQERNAFIFSDARDPLVSKMGGAFAMFGDLTQLEKATKTVALVGDDRPVSDAEKNAIALMVKDIGAGKPDVRILTNAETPIGKAVLQACHDTDTKVLGVISQDILLACNNKELQLLEKVADKQLGGIASLNTFLPHDISKTPEHATRAALKAADAVVLVRSQDKDMVTAMSAALAKDKPFFVMPQATPNGRDYSGNALVERQNSRITSFMPMRAGAAAMELPNAEVSTHPKSKDMVATMVVTNPARQLATTDDFKTFDKALASPGKVVVRAPAPEVAVTKNNRSLRYDLMAQIDFNLIKDKTYVQAMGLTKAEVSAARTMKAEQELGTLMTGALDMSQMQTRTFVGERLSRLGKVTMKDAGREM